MREHGLLFSPPMIRALAAGRKFRTMRAISTHNSLLHDYSLGVIRRPTKDELGRADWSRARVGADGHIDGLWHGGCYSLAPRIASGDRIWSKETHARLGDGAPGNGYAYRADVEMTIRWTPSILQPRAAARFFLPVTEVFAQRPRNLTTAQILAEGIVCPMHTRGGCASFVGGCHHVATAWRDLWTEINGAESWERNEFCWVYVWKEIQRS